MYGLGKPRTKFGRFLDQNRITQEKFRGLAGLSRDLMADICNDVSHNPHENTMIKVIGTLRMMGYDVRISDFW